MAYETKNNTASVFRNERKREGKQDPDFTGSAVINGEAFWVDMWTKEPKEGKKGFFSVSFRSKEAQSERQADPAKRQYEINKPRHTPPPPLHKSAQPERQQDPIDKNGNYIY